MAFGVPTFRQTSDSEFRDPLCAVHAVVWLWLWMCLHVRKKISRFSINEIVIHEAHYTLPTQWHHAISETTNFIFYFLFSSLLNSLIYHVLFIWFNRTRRTYVRRHRETQNVFRKSNSIYPHSRKNGSETSEMYVCEMLRNLLNTKFRLVMRSSHYLFIETGILRLGRLAILQFTHIERVVRASRMFKQMNWAHFQYSCEICVRAVQCAKWNSISVSFLHIFSFRFYFI